MSSFFKLSAEGLEDCQLGIIHLYAFARETIGSFDDRDSKVDEGQVRSAPSLAAAVVAALSGEDGVCYAFVKDFRVDRATFLTLVC